MTLPYAGLATLCLIWGLSIPATKFGVMAMPAILVTTFRYATAAPFFAFLAWRGPRPALRDLIRLAILGMIGIDGGQVAQALGVARTPASVATVLSSTIPILVAVLAAWRLHQALRPIHVVGLLLAATGVGVIAFAHGSAAGAGLAGVVLMLLSALAVAVYYVLAAEMSARLPAASIAAWSSLFGTVPLLVAMPWLGHATPTAVGVASVLYLGLLVTVAGVWIWFVVLRLVPARIAAGTQYIQPVIGVAASAMLFGDRLGTGFYAGAALVLAGIALVARPGRPG
ncbi:MAG: DMT family transporter [Rhodospirillales bacterium]|nr:DMT family transporter [Rhodospirillales bacterium]